MRKTLMNLAAMILAVAACLTIASVPATAAGKAGTVGVGAEYQLSGLGGASLNYDAGKYHVGGFLGFSDGGGDDDTDIHLGGRFYYHAHSTAMSDFSVGGSLGIGMFGDRSKVRDDNTTEMFIEPGVQIRAFVANNVAVSIGVGLSLAAADAEGLEITGQTVGAAGVHYYFF